MKNRSDRESVACERDAYKVRLQTVNYLRKKHLACISNILIFTDGFEFRIVVVLSRETQVLSRHIQGKIAHRVYRKTFYAKNISQRNISHLF